MDTLTHIALGACIGESFFERGFGKKAMFWGALAQSIPDIDFIASLWLSPAEALLAHRGFTHSLLFVLLIVPVFAILADRVHRPHNIRFLKWLIFFFIEVLLHVWIDLQNSYGIGLWEPFSHQRFSFNTLFVADPFFSLIPALSFLMLLILNAHHRQRGFWWKLAILVPFVYMFYGFYNKYQVTQTIQQSIEARHFKSISFFSTPTPLQNWLWYVVVQQDSGFQIGYTSVFDSSKNIRYRYYPQQKVLLKNISDHESLQRLIRFSQGYYTVVQSGDTLVFNDLRFQQIIGWEKGRSQFVFHYYLQHPADNKLVVQRGRFDQWDGSVFKRYVKRVFGENQ